MMILLLAQAAESLSGGAGWVGAGLLGAVLAWLLFFHLPAKDKQIMDLLQLQIAERKEDAERRIELANKFTLALSECLLTQRDSLKDVVASQKEEIRYMQDQHDKSQEKDRSAFDVRTETIKLAIEKQTADLHLLMTGTQNSGK